MPYQQGDILLDKYRIESLLGQGAFGEVYKVTYLPLLQLRALKVLRRQAAGISQEEFTEAQMRFRNEALLGAQLNSSNPDPH